MTDLTQLEELAQKAKDSILVSDKERFRRACDPDTILALCARAQQTQWVSVKSGKFPNPGQRVLAWVVKPEDAECHAEEHPWVSVYLPDSGLSRDAWSTVTHWQPIISPAAPPEVSDAE
jgi:hypothetical protein